jgi:hypothetical protein
VLAAIAQSSQALRRGAPEMKSVTALSLQGVCSFRTVTVREAINMAVPRSPSTSGSRHLVCAASAARPMSSCAAFNAGGYLEDHHDTRCDPLYVTLPVSPGWVLQYKIKLNDGDMAWGSYGAGSSGNGSGWH